MINTLIWQRMDIDSYIGLIILLFIFLFRFVLSNRSNRKKEEERKQTPVRQVKRNPTVHPIKKHAPKVRKKALPSSAPPIQEQKSLHKKTVTRKAFASLEMRSSYHKKKKRVPTVKTIVKNLHSKRDLILLSEIMRRPYID